MTVMHYLVLSTIIFIIGVVGIFINKKSIINILMSIELMLLSVNINFVAFSVYLNDYFGQIMTIFILTVAAAEASIGLAILICYFRNNSEIDVENVSDMRG